MPTLSAATARSMVLHARFKPPAHALGRVTASALAAVLCAFGAIATAAAAPATTGSSSTLYCCQDATGKQVCGDILPQACYGRGYREIGDGARTVRQVEAPLTPEQRAQRAAEEEKKRIEEAARREQQRKDQALLNTYGTERDIDAMRLRSEEDVNKSIKDAEYKISEIRTQRKKFETEFYKKKTVPADIQKGLRDTDSEIKAQESIIEAKRKELDIIRVKYDEDKKRFLDLTRRGVRPQ